MLILQTYVAPEEVCPYLDDERWRLKYQWIGAMEANELDSRLSDGWFKYGQQLQRPICATCRKCLSMRIPVEELTLSRAQRRALKKNEHLTVRFTSPPPCDEERLSLHYRYREAQHLDRNWAFECWDRASYAVEFVHGPLPMTEISVWEGEQLRAVVLADVGKDVVAGVTHYYDPDLRGQSIGLFAMLQTFALAQQLNKHWVYLGYYVENSPTMGYKIQFLPCELRGWDGAWRRYERAPEKIEDTLLAETTSHG